MTDTIRNGDTVKVAYTGKYGDGTVFDSTQGRGPMKFVVGDGTMINAFNHAVTGMRKGEKGTYTFPPVEAFGEHDPEAVVKMKRSEFPEGMQLMVGRPVRMMGPDGRPKPSLIKSIDGEDITIDTNHPLAGKTVIFDIEILEHKTADEAGEHCNDPNSSSCTCSH